MRAAMQNLRERWGLSTSEIARALGISERVARLARDGSEPAEGAERLDDFLERLHVQASIDEPGTWMSSPIADGYTITRWDVYVGGHPEFVVMNANLSMNDYEILESFDPDWRRTYRTSFTTFVAEDGNLSTRGKTYDEVRAQV